MLKNLLETSIYRGVISYMDHNGQIKHKNAGYILATSEEVAENEFHILHSNPFFNELDENVYVSVEEVFGDDEDLPTYFAHLLVLGLIRPPLAPMVFHVGELLGFDGSELQRRWERLQGRHLKSRGWWARKSSFIDYLKSVNQEAADIFVTQLKKVI